MVLTGAGASAALAGAGYLSDWRPRSTVVLGDEIRYVRKEDFHMAMQSRTGTFVGTIAGWKGGSPPANFASLLESHRGFYGNDSFNYWWADNVRTIVIVRLNLRPLPGFGDDESGIYAHGVVTSDTHLERDSLNARLEFALKDAVTHLAANLGASGIRESTWSRLLEDAAARGWRGGVPFEVTFVRDEEEQERTLSAAYELNQMLDARAQRVRRIPALTERLVQMSRSYAQGDAASVWSRAREAADKDNLPAAWFWRAWERIDRNDYGPETVALVEKAESALAKLANRGRELPVVVSDHSVRAIGSCYDTGEIALESFESWNAAYVGYLRGVLEENLASRASDPTTASEHRARAGQAFSRWAGLCGDEPFGDACLMRVVAIAMFNGSRGYQRDTAGAIAMFQQAADMGSIDSLNWLGLIYDTLGGPFTDSAKARTYFEKAAAQNNAHASFNLSWLHLFGAGGVKPDRARALQYYHKNLGQPTGPLDPYFTLAALPPVEAHSSAGDTLRVTCTSGDYPLNRIAAAGDKPTPGRDVEFRIEYHVASGGAARVEIVPDWNGISTEINPRWSASPRNRVVGTGQTTAWIGFGTAARYVGVIRVNLLDASEDRVLAGADVPIVARWERGTLPTATAASSRPTEAELEQLDQQFQEAGRKASGGDLAGAIAIYDAILLRLPDSAQVLAARGLAKGFSSDLAGATADLDRAIQLDPRLKEAFRARALVRSAQNDNHGSLEDLNAALALAPNDPDLLLLRGSAHVLLGQGDAALEDFTAVLDAQTDNIEALFQRGRLQEARGNESAALADYSRAIQLHPELPNLYNARSSLRFGRGDWDGAAADCTETLKLAPDDVGARTRLGYVRFAQADYAGAASEMAGAAAREQGDGAIYALTLRHYALLRAGRPDDRLKQAVAGVAKPSWAQSIGQFAAGLIDEDTLDRIAREPADEQERINRDCELNFYIALSRIQSGDKSTARLRLRQTIESPRKNYNEWILAGPELKRL